MRHINRSMLSKSEDNGIEHTDPTIRSDTPSSDCPTFICDEEPLVLSIEHGFGHNPLMIGHAMVSQSDARHRLTVVRKLGWSKHSSVWLAHVSDTTYQAKFVAIKVLTAACSRKMSRGEQHEYDILQLIRDKNSHHRGYRHCVQLMDVFTCMSHHGPHICLVTEVLGESVLDLRKQRGGMIPLPLVKRIIKQVLLALEYIHDECRVVHTCIRAENLLLRLYDTDETVQQLLESSPSLSYKPRHEPSLSSQPIITVKSQPIPVDHVPHELISVRLVDFGQARHTSRNWSRFPEGQKKTLLAPEVILGGPWSKPVDIWSIGCLVFECLTGVDLFQLYDESGQKCEAVHLRRMIEHVGPFPQSVLDKSRLAKQFFDEQGCLMENEPLVICPIEKCLQAYDILTEKEILSTAAFMRKCLTVDAQKRPTASQLLREPWIS